MGSRALRRLLESLLFVAIAACGGRIAPDESAAGEADAAIVSSEPPAPPSPSPSSPAASWSCYGAVTEGHDTNCSETHTPSGVTCAAALTCNGHVLTMKCEGGHCVCDNPGLNNCVCDAPAGLVNPCGVGNCCWR